MEYDTANSFDAISDENSHILILGTIPSVQSRDAGFYYAHPRNRFWLVLAKLFGRPIPEGINEKKRLLLENGIALWDVLASCEISGSDDSSIRNPVFNDITALVSEKPIGKILCNGKKAYDLFQRSFCLSVPVVRMPSTSPANASWSAERLIKAWKKNFKESLQNH